MYACLCVLFFFLFLGGDVEGEERGAQRGGRGYALFSFSFSAAPHPSPSVTPLLVSSFSFDYSAALAYFP